MNEKGFAAAAAAIGSANPYFGHVLITAYHFLSFWSQIFGGFWGLLKPVSCTNLHENKMALLHPNFSSSFAFESW